MVRAALAAMTFAIALGCAETPIVRYDFYPGTAFATYETFAWMQDDPLVTAAGSASEASPLLRRRVTEVIENELGAKGYRRVADRSAADFVVAYTMGARDKIDVDSYPGPYRGRWSWGWPYFGSRVDVNVYQEGRLAIDVFDGRLRQPVWHGRATKRLSAEDVRLARDRVGGAVKEILKNFPPPTTAVQGATGDMH
jgi:hypothetical protein